ncbi:IS256 family transposase [Candidatus Darwinibacter acetoxidans]|jgi:transposase-like protein
MNGLYQVAGKTDTRKIAEFLSQDGQLLLPFLELICNAEQAVDEVIKVTGKAAVEAILLLSAQQVAGPKQPGKAKDINWHGWQPGVVSLAERKLRIEKPRLRRKGKGAGTEVPIPAYEAMATNGRITSRILEILMKGVSTRNYKEILPEMAETVGVSKSQISREFVAASEEQIKALCERRFDDVDILAIYLDGIQFNDCHVIVALGVDSGGCKHVLGIREGASENKQVVMDLLTDMVERGVGPDRLRLFVIDGSKALRQAIDAVYGSKNPVQRCRNHKIRNVMDYLPEDQKDQVKSAMTAAFLLDADKGTARLKQLAKWLEQEYPSAAASLLEGLDEMFTLNRLGLPSSLRRCLATTNVIESPNGGIRSRTGRVKNWRDHAMVVRWVAASLLDMEKRFRRIMGYQQLWMLDAKLKALAEEERLDIQSRAV